MSVLRSPFLVTGAAGTVGGVARTIVDLLCQRGLPVRALVRHEDKRGDALRSIGAEVVVGDLTRITYVARALAGCRRLYFGMSVSAPYLEATVIAAAVARERGDLEVFVNISQMTVSQMTLANMTDSPQQRQHWLADQLLNWSGLPVVQVLACTRKTPRCKVESVRVRRRTDEAEQVRRGADHLDLA
jgi:NAD(P)H dehydrogenase (quinone)